jgi:PiT family inorganic phosphate transporter
MIGGLCGSTLAAANGNWAVIKWSVYNETKHAWEGLFHKVMIPMISSPIIGFLGGFLVMGVLYFLLRNWRPRTVNRVFGKLQLLSAAYMGYSHGTNDAQKTMGIITLALFTATSSGSLKNLPDSLHFLITPKFEIPLWVKIACALTMAAGTASGGWRIIKTLGHKMVRLKPVHGFAAEFTAATILTTAARLGMPVSTTHAITTSIMGVGTAKSPRALKWSIVERIVWAWVLTLPITAIVAYSAVNLVKAFGGKM